MTDYSAHLLAARTSLTAAYAAAEARHFAAAIRLAWQAEADCAALARALEQLRVEEAGKAGGL